MPFMWAQCELLRNRWYTAMDTRHHVASRLHWVGFPLNPFSCLRGLLTLFWLISCRITDCGCGELADGINSKLHCMALPYRKLQASLLENPGLSFWTGEGVLNHLSKDQRLALNNMAQASLQRLRAADPEGSVSGTQITFDDKDHEEMYDMKVWFFFHAQMCGVRVCRRYTHKKQTGRIPAQHNRRALESSSF
jgi:hypothetical protein